MKIQSDKYPIDIVLCIICSFILIPIVIWNLNEIIRIIIGLPYIFFIPGYILLFCLFPTKKTDIGINIIERITLSIGFSIAIVSTIGFALNYTSSGIQLQTIYIYIFIFINGLGLLGIYRWKKLDLSERFKINFEIPKLKSKNKIDLVLNLIIIFSIIIVITVATYALITPKQKEKTTEFYLLGSSVNSTNFTSNTTIGENYSVIIGVANHEYKTIDYTIEIWLINQSQPQNNTTIQNMWFVDKISTRLSHIDMDTKNIKKSQWEYPYSFIINKTGLFKLTFLLYKTQTDEYIKDADYKDIALEKINTSYRETHLWINIT